MVEHQGPVELVVDIGQLGFDLEQARNIRSVDLLYTPVENTVVVDQLQVFALVEPELEPVELVEASIKSMTKNKHFYDLLVIPRLLNS